MTRRKIMTLLVALGVFAHVQTSLAAVVSTANLSSEDTKVAQNAVPLAHNSDLDPFDFVQDTSYSATDIKATNDGHGTITSSIIQFAGWSYAKSPLANVNIDMLSNVDVTFHVTKSAPGTLTGFVDMEYGIVDLYIQEDGIDIYHDTWNGTDGNNIINVPLFFSTGKVYQLVLNSTVNYDSNLNSQFRKERMSTDWNLTLEIVPEPSTFTLAFIAGMAGIFVVRRRRA